MINCWIYNPFVLRLSVFIRKYSGVLDFILAQVWWKCDFKQHADDWTYFGSNSRNGYICWSLPSKRARSKTRNNIWKFACIHWANFIQFCNESICLFFPIWSILWMGLGSLISCSTIINFNIKVYKIL